MTQADRFMRSSIRRRLSLTTLLQISKWIKELPEEEVEPCFQKLNQLLERSRTEPEFCRMALGFTESSENIPEKRQPILRTI